MNESELVRLRRKNHETIASSRKRLLICTAISFAVWVIIILGSFVTS